MHLVSSLVIISIILNISVILGLLVCKLNYKKENKIVFVSNISIFLNIFLALYTLCLIVLSIGLLLGGKIILASGIFVLSLVPFMLGKLSSYRSANLFINIQIMALILNLFVLASALV